ncbi:MAG: ABC transporter substrate-binding protein [Candidatus Margulisiibacteriota bacterium]|jgi:branched-chain amino acid transport system substrate-binding protein
MQNLIRLFIVLVVTIILGFKVYAVPIKIGAIYNISGGQASLDLSSWQGAQLAFINYKKNYNPYQKALYLFLHDGKTNPTTIIKEATLMFQKEKAVIGFGLSDTDMVRAAAKAAKNTNRIFITSGATSPTLPNVAENTVFLTCFSDNAQAAAAAEFCYKNLKARTAYILFDYKTTYTQLLIKYFEEAFEHLGGNILYEDFFSHDDIDLKSQIAKLKTVEFNPDVLYIAAGPQDIGVIVKQIRKAGIKTPIIGGDSYDTPLLISTAGNFANQIYFSNHAYIANDNPNPAVKKFMVDYQNRFHCKPNAFAALGYDTFNLIATILKNTKSFEKKDLTKSIYNLNNFVGLTGNINYQNGTSIPKKDVFILKIDNKKISLAAVIKSSF